MFSKLAILLAISSVALALPSRIEVRDGTCSSGDTHCCDSIQPSSSTNSASLGGLIPINLQGLDIPIGINCDPISILGLGTAGSCSAQAACCSGGTSQQAEGVFGLDCSPIAAPL